MSGCLQSLQDIFVNTCENEIAPGIHIWDFDRFVYESILQHDIEIAQYCVVRKHLGSCKGMQGPRRARTCTCGAPVKELVIFASDTPIA